MPGETEPTQHPKQSCLVAEVISNSGKSFDDAILTAINSLLDDGVHVTGADVTGQKLAVNNGQITNFRVVLKVSYDGVLR